MGMLARLFAALLVLLPAALTGRTAPRAAAEVRRWTKGNPTLRTLRYGVVGRLVLWASDHPAGFAVMVAATVALIAGLIALPGSLVNGYMVLPWLTGLHPDPKTDVSGLLNTILGVQATLLGLVFPITLAFVALMLQRAAHSSVSLRVYLLDAAAVPVGASSIGLLVAAGLQYFVLPFNAELFSGRGMTMFLAFNGSWLLLNLLFTGFLLTRTIKFIQDREQRLAFTRIAVDTALRSELTWSVRQHIYVSEPQEQWKYSDKLTGDQPQVQMYSFSGSRSEVKIDLKADHLLEDVHLNLLRWVASRWSRRAAAQPRKDDDLAPTLIFPARLGSIGAGEVVLCAVQRGPGLTWFEKLAVHSAFWFKRTRRNRLSLSTRRMLEEIGAEVLAALEGRRVSMAVDRLREMNRLHRTLLAASEVNDQPAGGAHENTATIHVSPLSWSGTTFDREWLRPYYEISRMAISGIDEDLAVFRNLAGIPGGIALQVSPQPEAVVINGLQFGVNLAELLSLWWTRKADASLLPGEVFSGTIPAPMSKVYEQALLAFIGTWTEIHIDDGLNEADTAGDPALAWPRLASRAKIYAAHIEFSAQLFLQSVSRRDLTGASRWLDHFIKWRGSHDMELEHQLEHDFRARHVTLTLASKDWPKAHELLWDGEEPITTEIAAGALNLAIHRYWESMRLYLALLLTRTASTEQASGKELEYASALLRCAPLHPGSRVVAEDFDSTGAMLLYVLQHRLGTESAIRHLNAFGENLRWDAEGPEVSGWIYSMDGTPTALSTMQREQLMLMVTMARPRHFQLQECELLIESWWRDIDRLEDAIRICSEMLRDVLAEGFAANDEYIVTLRRLAGVDGVGADVRAARATTARALRRLVRVARRTRRITLSAHAVDVNKIQAVKQGVGEAAFAAPKLPAPIERLVFVPRVESQDLQLNIGNELKKRYLDWLGTGVDTHSLKRWGEHVLMHACAWAVARRIWDDQIAPVGDASWRNRFQPSHEEMQELIQQVVERCDQLRAAGLEPVILTSHSGSGSALVPYRWGDQEWRCPLPPGITLRSGALVGSAAARGYINDVPIYEIGTPDGDCFVVPAAMIKEVQIEGSSPTDALKIRWEQVGEDRLRFELQWKAAMAPSSG